MSKKQLHSDETELQLFFLQGCSRGDERSKNRQAQMDLSAEASRLMAILNTALSEIFLLIFIFLFGILKRKPGRIAYG